MINKLIKNKAALEHVFGLSGQITAGLPLLIITSLISLENGLEMAGQFTILVGLASTIYSIGMWGFRPLIVINKHNFSSNLFLVSRVFMLIISALIIFTFGYLMNYLWEFSLIVIIIKSSDAIIDLNFGFLQLRGSYIAFKNFAFLHVSKFVLIGVVFVFAYFSVITNVNYYIIFVCALLFLFYLFKIIKDEEISTLFEGVEFLKIKQLFFKSTVFVIATVLCAFLTNSPRFFLDFFNSGDLLGVIGICLSVSTLFGMVFNTNWQRYFSNYREKKNLLNYAIMYIVENSILAILLSVFSYIFLPYFVSKGFGIDLDIHRVLMTKVFISYIVFNLGMSTANLYKWTEYPIYESYVYLTALLIPIIVAVMFPKVLELYHLLLLSGVIMLIVSLYSFIIFKYDK